MTSTNPSPHGVTDEETLELLLSEPSDPLVEALGRIPGDILVLGAGGKMGPTLARMARRASDAANVDRRVIAVSRFADSAVRQRLNDWGVETQVGDLFDAAFVKSLPSVANILYLVGVKFGTDGAQAKTWAANAYLPGAICEKFPESRIVALSTGNVYGLVPTGTPGSREGDPVNPDGEYAMSALGRERVFEFFSRERGIPLALIRLNYAAEMRYGVLVDLAQKVFAGESIPLGTGYLNVIWQADANCMILRSLEHVSTPPLVLNVTGPEKLACRELGMKLGELLGRDPQFSATESDQAFLSDASRAIELFGPPRRSADELLRMTARLDRPRATYLEQANTLRGTGWQILMALLRCFARGA